MSLLPSKEETSQDYWRLYWSNLSGENSSVGQLYKDGFTVFTKPVNASADYVGNMASSAWDNVNKTYNYVGKEIGETKDYFVKGIENTSKNLLFFSVVSIALIYFLRSKQ